MEYKQYAKLFLNNVTNVLNGRVTFVDGRIVFMSNEYKWVYHWNVNRLIHAYNNMIDVDIVSTEYITDTINAWKNVIIKGEKHESKECNYSR